MKDAHSKKVGQIWTDHLVERVVQEESKRRGGRFHPERDRSSRLRKIDRRAVLGVNWYASVQNSQLSNCIVDVWIIFTHEWAPRQSIPWVPCQLREQGRRWEFVDVPLACAS